MTVENNPLKQFFRRPAVYVKLPSGGKYYEPGVVNMPENGELPVYPMTAIDEITSKTPDALFNGAAVADIVASCIPAIKEPWKINSVDLDAILIGIRIAGGNGELEIESKCPACEQESTYGIPLASLLPTLQPGNYDEPLQLSDLKIKFKPITYRDMNNAGLGQFEVQKQFVTIQNETDPEIRQEKSKAALLSITTLTMSILAGAIEYVETPTTQVTNKEHILEYLKSCDNATFVKIRDHNTALKESSEIKPLGMKCIACSHEYKQTLSLNLSDFFV